MDKNGKIVEVDTDGLDSYTFKLPSNTGDPENSWDNPFIDVTEGVWFYDAVHYCYINHLMRGTTKIKDVCGRLVMTVPYEADYAYKREQLEKWYRKQALCVFKEKAREFAVTIGVSFQDIHIKDQKSRWGSCSSKGNLNFNWRILMAPEPVCDYVIIHELCHLVYMDHSADFWHLVEQLCPSYRQYKKWLRDRADLLYKF